MILESGTTTCKLVFLASIYSNYVDYNWWLGDLILSEGTADIFQKYPVPECDIWFIKFSCDFHYNAAALVSFMLDLPENREGKIFVWVLQSSPSVLIAKFALFLLTGAERKFLIGVFNGVCYVFSLLGYLMRSQSLQLDERPCPLREAPFSVAVRMGRYGTGMLPPTN
ncbi:hypothetical protein PTKIN_Ptkin14bG0058400 [Pterospermum kingtungense]